MTNPFRLDDASVLQFLAQTHDDGSFFALIVNALSEQFEADAADLLIKTDDEKLVLVASTLAPEMTKRLRIATEVGITGACAMSGHTVSVSEKLNQSELFVKYPGYSERAYSSAVAQPLFVGEAVVGVLYLRREANWKLKAADSKALNQVAQTLGRAIAAAQTVFERSRAEDRVEAVSHLASNITASPYLEEILQLLVHLTAQQFNYKVCTVRLLDPSSEELVLRATQATVRAYRRKRAIKLGESIAGRVVLQKTTAIVRDVQAEPDYIGHDLAIEQSLRSMICVPLTIQDRVLGVLTCYTDEIRDFDQSEVTALETVARQAAIAIEHAKLQVRNTLMQEMHHRVKNNLQQIVSLLRLQMRHRHYKSIDEAINDTLSRILAIAAVHDLLSREDLDHVNMRSIAQVLVNHQTQSFISPDKTIRFEVRGDDIRLAMTQATQVALILNELIQNAVEHGFKGTQSGDVHVNIEVLKDTIGLWVSNNGDELEAGFDPTKSANLGLQIVQNLSRSLGGSLLMENRLGWTVTEVTFPRTATE